MHELKISHIQDRRFKRLPDPKILISLHDFQTIGSVLQEKLEAALSGVCLPYLGCRAVRNVVCAALEDHRALATSKSQQRRKIVRLALSALR